MNNFAFRPAMTPDSGDKVLSYNISCSGTTAQQKLNAASSVRLANLGTVTIFVNFGTKNATAVAATDIPILAGAVEVFSVPNGTEYICAITGGTAATLHVTPGDGV